MPKKLVYFPVSPCFPSQGITLPSATLNACEDPLKMYFPLNLLVLLTLLLGRYINATLAGNRSRSLGKDNCFLPHSTHSDN